MITKMGVKWVEGMGSGNWAHHHLALVSVSLLQHLTAHQIILFQRFLQCYGRTICI